ncbi:MAG TPA: hypothetical protein VMT62_09990 [Syntrophorhabdaceae bacterium]|nr:hypothetical protein [Syntrophorhabdaceae bacterium]
MTLGETVREAIIRLNPKFDELADGEAEFVSADKEAKTVTVRLSGGRLH